MTMNNDKRKNTEIVMRDLLISLRRYWYLVLIITVVSVIVSYGYTKLLCTPMYKSTASVYIVKKDSDEITSSDFSISSYLTKDYAEILVSRSVLEPTIKDLGLNASYNSLKSSITIENPQNTRFLYITVVHSNPKTAKDICDKICEIGPEHIVEMTGIDRVAVGDKAGVAGAPYTPNVKGNLIIGFLIGLALSLLTIVFMHYYLNEKIKNADDIEKHLNINVLGVIPYNKSAKGNHKQQ